ncbi:putative rna recognition domain-containing protein [Erysiphe necator]|uniref:Putative rna recognition domain-containing protein n=1 Tax=Uncinula necator TaxID=52586 RepID=A0A0B1NZU2_UNCNE|nr:putative rna recognition domain-containing protein [Erysiphe necator]
MSASTVYYPLTFQFSSDSKSITSGKITEIKVESNEKVQNATVTFEKETAAKTALLLDNTQLGENQVQVSSATGSGEDDGSHLSQNKLPEGDEITQEEKPRARIVAEYLAHGYVLGDQTLQRAIDLDNKHGVTTRFMSTLQKLDSKYHATDKAKSVDQSYGVTPKVTNFLSGLSSFYEKAAGTPSGKKLVDFYTQTSRQVLDIHNEALRLAKLKKEASGNSSPEKSPSTTSSEELKGKISEKQSPENSASELPPAASLGFEKGASV